MVASRVRSFEGHHRDDELGSYGLPGEVEDRTLKGVKVLRSLSHGLGLKGPLLAQVVDQLVELHDTGGAGRHGVEIAGAQCSGSDLTEAGDVEFGVVDQVLGHCFLPELSSVTGSVAGV